jgi:hypothetical protein
VVTAVPCFARGTMIRTPEGERPVESLLPGDLIETRDHGPQPLRWLGSRTVAATGRFAPVVIEAGTFGLHRRLVVSPQHRILLTHWMAELMFGEDEVLVAAKDLVNDCSVRIVEGGSVDYFHLLFDSHQIVWSEGLETESFLPGPSVMNEFEEDVREEVLALFPEIDPDRATRATVPRRDCRSRRMRRARSARGLSAMAWAAIWQDGTEQPLGGFASYRSAEDAPLDALTLFLEVTMPGRRRVPLRLWQGAAGGHRAISIYLDAGRRAARAPWRDAGRRDGGRVPRARAGARVAHGAMCARSE